ncbi:YdcF family protein [Bacillus dakarensis]|uniref:YdcF family protein n=1 Tax=Robertmurraya dakarensis TaxID=1926278 RepID=UPI00098105EB|nr:YdcF family protein [Bacillus dakarensis]
MKAVIFSLVILVILSTLVMIVGKDFLVVNEKPEKSDVIIVLSGNIGRLEKAAQLYKEDYADYVMLTRAHDPHLTVKDAVEIGIPEDALILEENATSTYTNAAFAKSEMEQHQLTSAIVISSDYHMRRTKFTFDKVFKDSDFDLIYVAAENQSPWYSTKGPFFSTISECIKLAAYKLELYEYIDLE